MNKDFIRPNPWSIIVDHFEKEDVPASESLFSLGNGVMGQRANFEERYSGPSLQGNYIGGIYYPDKTRVGWWKNGYPEYFAKVLNTPNWIGINVKINDQVLDLNTCKVISFHQELNMKEGWLERSFVVQMPNFNKVKVASKRFLSLRFNEIGAIKYSITPLNFEGNITVSPYIDAGIVNQDSNYDEYFWKVLNVSTSKDRASITSKTLKTAFHVCTAMTNRLFLDQVALDIAYKEIKKSKKIKFKYRQQVKQDQTLTLYKYASCVQSMNHNKEDLAKVALDNLEKAADLSFDKLLDYQKEDWADIWQMSDIKIEGDTKAQQAIRFNIFQLNQTYLGEDARLNIGPKGFTGEKYGGSTYWDTEAYCIPFYMATKDKHVAKNLLLYRYNHLEKAIENAKKLGFTNGAALYPMVTMNGEECHNEWEITFEEIHRNGAMVYGIYNYVNYTGDYEYIPKYGLEVMIAIARFWTQRSTFSKAKNQYVILGVTGPNEYENNVNNNFYTNYLAQWCINFTLENIAQLKTHYTQDLERVLEKTTLGANEIEQMREVAENMYLPFSNDYEVFLQQDAFLDKEIVPASYLPKSQRPINQHWSWDRILRSCYIKQADVLQGIYMFENAFDDETIKKHFDFYEPLTVHESSLSPCIHSILAAKINRIDKAYEMYLRTARLDLDDYNNEVAEGCHITSMAGTWMTIVQGFGGMRTFNNILSFNPQIPKQWQSYAFTINYRGIILKITKTKTSCVFTNKSDEPLNIEVYGKNLTVHPKGLIKI
ncbi:MAG: family 65 glycosyl hydrolase domain-containing protein [Flavobacteriaceae bacterium]